MTRVVALIDGEHYPPVVRYALSALALEYEVVAAAFIGGTEKVDGGVGAEYGVPVVVGATPDQAVIEAIERYAPQALIDLSDEPVLSVSDRFRIASLALGAGVEYRGADFRFSPPRTRYTPTTPALAIIGTGKRVGKTSLSAYVARTLKAVGLDIAVLAMGRGGPAEPEIIHGEKVELTTADLLDLARQGIHACSDNYEDAVMSRVTTIGCRRCGGGIAGETFFSNVPDGARLADSLQKQLILLEGSGSAIPPVYADASILVVGGDRSPDYVDRYFGPYRVRKADLVVITSAEAPMATIEQIAEVRARIAALDPDLPVVATIFRPVPLESIEGRRVLFATTAPETAVPVLAEYLESQYGCGVVATTAHLADRTQLREALERHAGTYDLLLTELKAAAIDVVAAEGERVQVPTVLCDNVPVAIDGHDLDEMVRRVAANAIERGRSRSEGVGA